MYRLSFSKLLSAEQITSTDIANLALIADKYRQSSDSQLLDTQTCKGKILASLFFEPSTRTRFSFESAMLRLGGNVISLEQANASSISKGETLADTGRMINNYADIAVVRHNQSGSSYELAKYAQIPVINGGDGDNQHPSQALIDVYTILCLHKRLDNLKIAIVGDLKYSRTVRSLLNLLSKYNNNHIYLISHPDLALKSEEVTNLKNNGLTITSTTNLHNTIQNVDVLYSTRIQQERFTNQESYTEFQNLHHITPRLLENAQDNLTILHPLPRVNEIDTQVDNLSCAKYFQQAEYGLYLRMALLDMLLNHT